MFIWRNAWFVDLLHSFVTISTLLFTIIKFTVAASSIQHRGPTCLSNLGLSSPTATQTFVTVDVASVPAINHLSIVSLRTKREFRRPSVVRGLGLFWFAAFGSVRFNCAHGMHTATARAPRQKKNKNGQNQNVLWLLYIQSSSPVVARPQYQPPPQRRVIGCECGRQSTQGSATSRSVGWFLFSPRQHL